MTQATEERVTENLEQNIIEKSFSFSSEEAEEKEQLGVVGALDEEEVESSNLKDAFNLKSDVGLTTDDMADSEMEDSPIVPRDGEVDFENFYEGIDFEALLAQYYADWLDKVQDKQFYKVFSQLFELYNAKTLNYLEREFLWKFAKAINSTIMLFHFTSSYIFLLLRFHLFHFLLLQMQILFYLHLFSSIHKQPVFCCNFYLQENFLHSLSHLYTLSSSFSLQSFLQGHCP